MKNGANHDTEGLVIGSVHNNSLIPQGVTGDEKSVGRQHSTAATTCSIMTDHLFLLCRAMPDRIALPTALTHLSTYINTTHLDMSETTQNNRSQHSDGREQRHRTQESKVKTLLREDGEVQTTQLRILKVQVPQSRHQPTKDLISSPTNKILHLFINKIWQTFSPSSLLKHNRRELACP